jgi:hypothetical protein
MWLGNELTDDEKALNLVKRKARSAYAAQRKRGEHFDDIYSRDMAKRFNFGLELKPVDNPVAFKKEFYDQLNKEYAIRYLETIGANATPATIRMIQQNMPLEKKMVSAAWKSRGGLDDRLYIAPHVDKRLLNMRKRDKGKNSFGRKRGATAPSSSETVGRKKGGGRPSPLKQGRRRRRPLSQPSGSQRGLNQDFLVDKNGLPVMNLIDIQQPVDPQDVAFEIMKRKYIFPFNTPSNPKFLHPLPDLNAAYRTAAGGTGKENNKASPSSQDAGGNRKPGEDARDRQNMNHELTEPLKITMKNIGAQQRRFTTAFPFARLQGKLDKETSSEISKVLSSSVVKKLIGLTAHYIYWTDFRNISGIHSAGYAPLPKAKLKELTRGLHECWRKIETGIKVSQNGVLFVLPIILLSVRVAMETIFPQAYPLWFAFEKGVKDTLRSSTKLDDNGLEWVRHAFQDTNCGPLGPTLIMINGRISELFDPKRYYGRISALESTTEGIRILEKASRCKGRKSSPPPIALNHLQRAILRRFQKYNNRLSAARQKKKALFYATSNHVNGMIPKPNTAAARKIFKKGRS